MIELGRPPDRANLRKPIKEVGMYIGIGTALVILILVLILV